MHMLRVWCCWQSWCTCVWVTIPIFVAVLCTQRPCLLRIIYTYIYICFLGLPIPVSVSPSPTSTMPSNNIPLFHSELYYSLLSYSYLNMSLKREIKVYHRYKRNWMVRTRGRRGKETRDIWYDMIWRWLTSPLCYHVAHVVTRLWVYVDRSSYALDIQFLFCTGDTDTEIDDAWSEDDDFGDFEQWVDDAHATHHTVTLKHWNVS